MALEGDNPLGTLYDKLELVESRIDFNNDYRLNATLTGGIKYVFDLIDEADEETYDASLEFSVIDKNALEIRKGLIALFHYAHLLPEIDSLPPHDGECIDIDTHGGCIDDMAELEDALEKYKSDVAIMRGAEDAVREKLEAISWETT